MSFDTWKNYIHSKYKFYGTQPGRSRKDAEFPWGLLEGKLDARVKRFPPVRALYWSINSEKRWSKFEEVAERIFEVRNLLNDELSVMLYDESTVLRLVEYDQFYYPRYNFDSIIDLVSKEKFLEKGYPDNYLGVPLERFVVSLVDRPGEKTITVIAISGFVDLINNWQQYFRRHGGVEFTPRKGDVVFDCGACIGDVTTVIAGMIGHAGQVHSFDPVPLHNRFLALQAEANPDLAHVFFLNQLAVGKKTTKVHAGLKVDSDQITPGGLDIENFDVCSIDDYCKEQNIARLDFIKMDVEGAEPDAILGAQGVIREFKPRLAVSIYHHPDHFWSLPLLIKQSNPEYRLSFGHHSPLSWESVIYAHAGP